MKKIIILLLMQVYASTVLSQDIFWEQTNGPFFTEVTSLMVNSNNNAFCGIKFLGIYRTTNSGENWIDASQGLGDYWILSMDSNSKGDLFAAATWGLYRSSNDGESWSTLVKGGNEPSCITIFVKRNGYLFAGTFSKGVYLSIDNGNTWVQKNNGIGNKRIISFTENLSGDIFAGTDSSIFNPQIMVRIGLN